MRACPKARTSLRSELTILRSRSPANNSFRFIEEFRGLAWSEVKPKYLDYPNAQFLLIGEKVESATEPTTKDKKHDKMAPIEELEMLE
jgi:hypothetical protein